MIKDFEKNDFELEFHPLMSSSSPPSTVCLLETIVGLHYERQMSMLGKIK